jgi:glyoxylase-like metal-dependent hydrolase (beta-lactamase superfamily II)
MQVTENIHSLKLDFQIPIAPGKAVDRFVYVYIIYGKDICLIDSGVATSKQTIFDYLPKIGRKPENISLLILTHAHPDHIGAAQTIQQKSGCVIAAHSEAQAWIEDVDLQFKERPVPGFHTIVDGSVKLNWVLEEGYNINWGKHIKIEVIHTPGHSRCSTSFLLLDESTNQRILFSADAIPIPGDIPIYDDVLTSVESIKKLKRIENLDYLLSAWDVPRKGEQIHQVMDNALGYLQQIHEAIIKFAGDDPSIKSIEPMELCKQVVDELKLHPAAANPLVAKSFLSHLKLLT